MLNEHTAKSFFGNPFSVDSLFRDLTPKALESLARIKRVERFRKGVCFIEKGETPRGIYLLRTGRARIFLNAEFDIRPVAPNEILGLTETIADLPYWASAETVSPCLFEFIEQRDFIRFLREQPGACYRLVRSLGLNFQKSYQNFCDSYHRFQ